MARTAALGSSDRTIEGGLPARRFSTTTRESLVADLRQILDPQYATRAREIATRMTKPAESVAAAADLLEDAVRRKAQLTDARYARACLAVRPNASPAIITTGGC